MNLNKFADVISDEPNVPHITPQSPEGRERAKWEQDYNNPFGLKPLPREQGGRFPRIHQEYPKMLYLAGRPDGGNIKITEQQIAKDEHERVLLEGQGYTTTQQGAIDRIKADHVEHAKLAAERHYQEVRMSPLAQAEAVKVDQETVQHVPVIPETPIKRRGRPKTAKGTEAP